jgi:hypothetical protein
MGYDRSCPQRRLGKFEVWVYTRNERGHRPHVHVFYGGAEVVIFIGVRAKVRENPGAMKAKDVREARPACYCRTPR